MALSILIAKLYGTVCAAFGLGILINMKFYKKLFEDMYKSTTFIFVWGLFATIIGLLIVLNHNFWVADWTVLVTIIGWIGLIKGLYMLILPEYLNVTKGMFKSTGALYSVGFCALIFGCILGYFGFFA